MVSTKDKSTWLMISHVRLALILSLKKKKKKRFVKQEETDNKKLMFF
jgi:hypothetical protein